MMTLGANVVFELGIVLRSEISILRRRPGVRSFSMIWHTRALGLYVWRLCAFGLSATQLDFLFLVSFAVNVVVTPVILLHRDGMSKACGFFGSLLGGGFQG